MTTPRPQTQAQEGFILIEVLVSAVILALVAGAVLTLITATTRSAASERNHSTAYALAQEAQARLRTMRISTLIKPIESRTETIGGTKFTIESKGLFINNSSGTSSCTESSDSSDYVQITSTVSSAALLHPVSIQSVVAPSSGSLDPSHGTLSFQAKNAAGEPLSGVSISGAGTSNFSGSTESIGCANFADLPNGNYKVTTSANGMINPEGTTSWTKEIGVPASGTQQVQILYDKAGRVEPSFVYREGSTSTLLAAPVDTMELYNAESGNTAATFGTPGGTRTAKLNDTTVFPFKTKYTIYAGSCESNNPDPKETQPANLAGIATVAVPAGGSVTPTIQVPAINLTVTNNSGIVTGAKVTMTDTVCKSSGTNVKRTYTTNGGGHPASTTTGATEAGVPWGTYKVCASAKIGTEYRKVEGTAAAENLANWTTLGLSLSGTGSTGSSSSSNQC